MTLDEMVQKLESLKALYSIGSYRDVKDAEIAKLDNIIAALKAGQAMYNGYTILERQGRQCGFLDSTEHGKLLTAWDAATKEDV
jgi:hypothetical protein